MNIYISMALLYLLVINNFETAYIFGICYIITMVLTDFIISLFASKIPDKLKLITSLLVSGIIVTIIEVLVSNFIPGFYNSMNIYLPLIMLGVYDYKPLKLGSRIKKTLLKSLKYVGLLLVLVLIKEILSYGTITLLDNTSYLIGYREIIKFEGNNILPIPYFDTFGSFLLVGIGLGLINKIRGDMHA